MNSEITGKIIVVGDNIDTDQIYPGCYLALTDPKEIGSPLPERRGREHRRQLPGRAALWWQAATSAAARPVSTPPSPC